MKTKKLTNDWRSETQKLKDEVKNFKRNMKEAWLNGYYTGGGSDTRYSEKVKDAYSFFLKTLSGEIK